MEMGDLRKKLQKCSLFLEKIRGTNLASFQGVCMNDIPIVEDLVQVNIFLYDIDFVDGAMIGELARSVGKHSDTVRLLCYSSHICYVFDIDVFFIAYRCPSCNTFLNRAQNLKRHLTNCSEGVEHVYLKNVYERRETLFDNLDSFGIPYTDNQKLCNNMAIFDFESICAEDEDFKDTETAKWNIEHIPIALSISSNLIQEPIFRCDPNPRDLVSSFIDALENLFFSVTTFWIRFIRP